MQPTGFRRLAALAAVAGTLCAAAPALAHPGHPGHETLGVWAGLAHPLSGADHLLAVGKGADGRELLRRIADGDWQPRFLPTRERARELLKQP